MKKILPILLLTIVGSSFFSSLTNASVVISGTSGEIASLPGTSMTHFLDMAIEAGDVVDFKITYDETTAGLNGSGPADFYLDAIEKIDFTIGSQSASVSSFLGSVIFVNSGTFDRVLFVADFGDFSFQTSVSTNVNQEFLSSALDPLGGISQNQFNGMNFENSSTSIWEIDDVTDDYVIQFTGSETQLNFPAVPEPASIAVWSLIGCFAAGGAYRKKRQR